MSLPQPLVTRFGDWLDAAAKAREPEPTAMCLSTCSEAGGVSARMVLLKDFSTDGFVFYTNLHSDKGRQLQANPEAALTFHWRLLEKQVRIEGRVELVSDEEADQYFASRDRGSQLGAWASEQSQAMSGRAELITRVAKVEAKHFGRKIPRPPHWSGYRLAPRMIEFWTGKKSRLHDRERFTLVENDWVETRLFP